MPYYLYRISPDRGLTPVDSYDRYRDARAAARRLRAAQNADDSDIIKMVFASHVAEAESLLTRAREATPSEDD